MSVLILRITRLGKFNFFNLAGYVWFVRPSINLVARLCILSMVLIYLFIYGDHPDHITEPYSNIRRTKDLYNIITTFSLLNLNVRLIKPSLLFAFAAL